MARGASSCRPIEFLTWTVFLLLAWPQKLLAAEADDLLFRSATDVNEGALRFLTETSAKAVHRHVNRITITESSLADGWVGMEQCHENLDAVPRAQVVYGQDRVRGIEVVSAERIGRAWAEANTVQLQDVEPGATLCVKAETRAMSRNGEASFNLANGPYMRKFLDGYYPLRVSMTVRLETPRLRFVDAYPEEQTGFHVWRRDTEVGYDALFEGELRTVLRFDLIP
ncbi:MAG: hypothetical protein MUC79_04150 [Thiobacillaceae bacterium]|jgi:hypothetical protein|nr:hypothetical protein [Thiobacillaceae bacterium]